MKLFNIAHFHRSRLRRLIESTGALGSIMISGAQIPAARGLLCWTRHELARRAVVSDATVYGLQTARGSAANPSTLAAVQTTLEAAGIDFLMALRRGCGYIPDPVMTPPNRNPATLTYGGGSNNKKNCPMRAHPK